MSELREAILFMEGISHHEMEQNIYSADEIIKACRSLIISEGSDIVGFVHLTAREWLGMPENITKLLSVTELAKCCLGYLQLFDSPCTTETALIERISKYKFSGHAARYWAEYVGEALHDDENINIFQGEILNTFKSPIRELAHQIYIYKKSPRSRQFIAPEMRLSLLHLMAERDMAILCERVNFDEDCTYAHTFIKLILKIVPIS